MEKISEEFMWDQRYRPRKIDDLILPDSIKKQIKTILSSGKTANFLFDGPPGTGKTTLAEAIAKEINADTLLLNGSSSGRGIETIRNDIPAFCSSVSMEHDQKIVFIDEADKLTPDAQDALKATIEQFSKGTAFIFTTNHKMQLTEALRSRFTEIDFTIPPNEINKLQVQLMQRVQNILLEEGIYEGEVPTEGKKILAEVIKTLFPHIRKILKNLQAMSVVGEGLDNSLLSVVNDERFETLVGAMKNMEWGIMRTWVVENNDITPDAILSWFWRTGADNFTMQKMPAIVMALNDYQNNVHNMKNPQIGLTALLTNIMQGLSR